jgi:hypothetical protein
MVRLHFSLKGRARPILFLAMDAWAIQAAQQRHPLLRHSERICSQHDQGPSCVFDQPLATCDRITSKANS